VRRPNEPLLLPSIAAAIGNAVDDGTGVRITDLPLTPERVLPAIASRRHKAG